jgi:hypothetical protein
MYPDYDHFELYASDGVADQIREFASAMTADARSCKLYRELAPAGSIRKSPFVSTAPPPGRPAGGPAAEVRPAPRASLEGEGVAPLAIAD